jgi:predicted DNA-binding antitoxin AbrB/MazE fold protein
MRRKSMYTIKAIYDGVNFKPRQPISVSGKHEVVITFLEPVEGDIVRDVQSKKRPLSELRGFLKGKVWMADDFNAPLEEMKEYME